MTSWYGPRNMATKRTLIQVRVTPEEKQHVEGAARAAGLTVSDYSRACLLGGGNGTYAVGGTGGLTRVTSNAALYATTSHLAAVENRLATLEQTPGVAEAIAKAQKHIQKKPTT